MAEEEQQQFIVLSRVTDGPPATPSLRAIADCGDECWISKVMIGNMLADPKIAAMETVCVQHMFEKTGGEWPKELRSLDGIRESLEKRYGKPLIDELYKDPRIVEK